MAGHPASFLADISAEWDAAVDELLTSPKHVIHLIAYDPDELAALRDWLRAYVIPPPEVTDIQGAAVKRLAAIRQRHLKNHACIVPSSLSEDEQLSRSLEWCKSVQLLAEHVSHIRRMRRKRAPHPG